MSRPWIVVHTEGGVRKVYRYATKSLADAEARKLHSKGYTVQVFHASRGF
jgi:hypothetical protein